MSRNVYNGVETDTATIASGASLSGAVSLGNLSLVGIIMPAAWTAADITFQVTPDGTNYYELNYTDGTAANAVAAVTIKTPTASLFIAIDPDQMRGVSHVKVRSGTSGSAVVQAADRDIQVVMRKVG